MLNKIRRFYALPSRGKAAFLQAGMMLFSTRLVLRRYPFQQAVSRLKQQAEKSPAGGFDAGVVDTCRWVEIWGRLLPGTYNCLPRAFTAYTLCRRQGYSVELKVGVAMGGDEPFEAHAWVEYENRIVIGNLPDLRRYHIFDSFSTYLN